MKKNSRFCFVLFGDRTRKKKNNHRPCHDAVLTYLVLLYLMQRNDGSRQLSFFLCVFVLGVYSGCGTDEPQEGRHTGSSAYQFPP